MKRTFFLIIIAYLSAIPVRALSQGGTFAQHYNATYITMNEGLSTNYIDDIFCDSQGFVWLSEGGGGLSRYDGYEFIRFNPSTPHRKLKSNFVRCTREDGFHRLWVASEGGIDLIDLRTLQNIPLRSLGQLPDGLATASAYHIAYDANGCIWLHDGHRLFRLAFDPEGNIQNIHTLSHAGLERQNLMFGDVQRNGKIWINLGGQISTVELLADGQLQARAVSDALCLPPTVTVSDFIATEGEIWISTNQGLYRYALHSQAVKHYVHIPGHPDSLTQDFLTALALDENRQLIVASLCGLNIYHPLEDNFEPIRSDLPAGTPPLLNNNFVNCLAVMGRQVWIGTECGGINLLSPKRLAVENYRHAEQDAGSLSPNPVNAIYEDEEGTLWVGTVEGGLNRRERGSKTFAHYTRESGSLGHNSVSALTADPKGRLWVGTWGGGITLLRRSDPRRAEKLLTPENCDLLPISFIGSLTYDSINNAVWIGANEGLYLYDLQQERVIVPLPDSVSTRIRGCIGSIIDRDGTLWIGCLAGTYAIDLHSRNDTPSGKFAYRHLKYKLDQPESGLVDKIVCFHQSKDGTLWLGSNGCGLYRRRVDADGESSFEAFTTADGLANNAVRTILGDRQGNLWIATDNGLSCFNPDKRRFVNYTAQDCLPSVQFYWNAACLSANGSLLFGHLAGLSAVRPDHGPMPPAASVPVRFTKLWIDNREVFAGSSLLPLDLPFTREISLHESTRSLALEFSALHYVPSPAYGYSYRLCGFDRQWIPLEGPGRVARYTNLAPGRYTLQVKYAPREGDDSAEVAEMTIIVRPYFYKTVWFLLLVVAACAVAVWQGYRWRFRSLKRRSEQQLTMEKIAFFTNITHEFRTPITLIVGPIERALKLSYNPQVIEQLQFVERNAKYLLSLVNQLMDFRKVESGKFEIVNAPGHMDRFTGELVAPFAVFARERNIDLKFYRRLPATPLSYDEEAMHKLLTNLLSNAIKFTPDGGSVSLFVALLPPAGEGAERLYISVRDSGSGIPPEEADNIFNRFYQVQNQRKYPMYGQSGSGIGLYLCQRIVKAMNGTITVRNNPSCGCTFRLLIPLTASDTRHSLDAEHADDADFNSKTQKLINSETKKESALSASSASEKFSETQKLTVLVVEDNSDMRGYIHSILRDKYQVCEAANGQEALDLLGTTRIDFIISDLMMPVMDGMELSRRVKADIAISHIPFLMLTAKTSQETRIESYRIGVDEYLLKPFDETLLLTRMENILAIRRRYQQKFALSMNPEELNIDTRSGDKKFVERVMEIMKAHYKDSDFDVSKFSEEAGVSRSLLNTKLQNLLGQSPAQFIRSYRLNLAHGMILAIRGTKEMSISEIAFEVGFNDPKYFSRCFSAVYHVSPVQLLNNH